MKKYIMVIQSVIIAAFLSGCTISADSEQELVYPSLDLQVKKVEASPYRVEIEEEVVTLEAPDEVTQNNKHNQRDGFSWISAKVKDGVRGHEVKKFAVSYNQDGERLSKVEIPEGKEVVPTTPTVYANGQKAQPGAYYTSERITRYGYDCFGCNRSNGRGGTSAGVGIGDNEVRQRNGSWKQGITYEGYYIIATSKAIPLCTIVEISNHTIEGKGIKKGVPFKAIVLDRGSAIQGSKTDLFVGSEKDPGVKMGSKRTVDIKIVEMNSRTGRGCGV